MMVSSDDNLSVTVSEAEWCNGFWLPHLSSFIDKDVSEEVSLQERSETRCREAGGDDERSRVWVAEELMLDTLDISVVPFKLWGVKAIVSKQESIGKPNVPNLL